MKLKFGCALAVLTFLCYESVEGGALKKFFSGGSGKEEAQEEETNKNERPQIKEEGKQDEIANNVRSEESKAGEQPKEKSEEKPISSGTDDGTESSKKVTPPAEKKKIEGNPVVFKVMGEEIHRDKVLEFITTLPPQLLQSVPSDKLFEIAKQQMLMLHLLVMQAKRAGLDKKKNYIDQLKKLSERLLSEMYLMVEVAPKAQNESALKARYQKYLVEYKTGKEVKLSHIAVDTEASAKEIVSALSKGTNFEKLRKEKGNNASENSDRYFPVTMIPGEIGAAISALKKGEYTKKPLKVGDGWHIFKVLDMRDSKPGTYEEVKPLLAQAIMADEMKKLGDKLRKQFNVEEFNEDGSPMIQKNN